VGATGTFGGTLTGNVDGAGFSFNNVNRVQGNIFSAGSYVDIYDGANTNTTVMALINGGSLGQPDSGAIIYGVGVGGNVANLIIATTFANVATQMITARGDIKQVDINANLSVVGNVTGSYFLGNGSQLTGISSGGSGSNIANGTSNVNIATANGNISFGVGGTNNVVIIDTGNIYAGNIRGPNANTAVNLVNYKDTVHAFGNATGTITPDAANGAIQNLTLTGNITLNAFGGNPQAGQSITLICKQDATGNRLLTSTMLWAGNTKTLSTGANAVDIINTFYDGSVYYASLSRGYV
jgi:hypothetical protein